MGEMMTMTTGYKTEPMKSRKVRMTVYFSFSGLSVDKGNVVK